MTIRILSLGAGVQSSTLALMIAKGEVPMVDCAIFADTKHEPAAVMNWLDALELWVPFPIYRVSRGDLWESATSVRTTRDGQRKYIKTAIPVHMVENGQRAGMGRRTCTVDYKIRVINAKVRELVGKSRIRSKDALVEMLIGISIDEADRMKPNPIPWIRSAWPLVDMNMSRADCQAWMEANGYPSPPRSACIFCPYRSDEHWLALAPEELERAAEMERELQAAYAATTEIKAVPFLHRSRVPLSEVKFQTGKRYSAADQTNMFRNDCLGMCGV